jgi:hypothetical protein
MDSIEDPNVENCALPLRNVIDGSVALSRAALFYGSDLIQSPEPHQAPTVCQIDTASRSPGEDEISLGRELPAPLDD